MTKLGPRDQLTHDILNISNEKYKMDIDDVIMTCLHVATALVADATKIGEDAKIRNRLVSITETEYNFAL